MTTPRWSPPRAAACRTSSRPISRCSTGNATAATLRRKPLHSRQRSRAEMAKRFRAYADVIDPKPPSVQQIKATLKPGEALLSFYFGREASFVWAVPKDGAVAFAAIPGPAGERETKIRKLREALEPQA